jgi:hypothetical protein
LASGVAYRTNTSWRPVSISSSLIPRASLGGDQVPLGVLLGLQPDPLGVGFALHAPGGLSAGDGFAVLAALHLLPVAALHLVDDLGLRVHALDAFERLGDQAGMARIYHNLGNVAYLLGDYDEATRQYQRSLDISERLGDQAGMASTYHQLGILAQDRGDYDEAARQYQHALDILERLGNQAGMARTYSQLGILEAGQPDGSAATVVSWQVKALVIRFRLGVPQAANNLRHLAAHRKALGPEQFISLLSQATGDTGLTEAITSLLDQLDAAETSGA